MRAGSMDRSASSMRSKPPASSIRTRTSMARSRSQHGATRKAISAVFSAAGPMSVPSPKRISTPPATATAARPCVKRCARSALPAGRASRPNAGGTSDISKPISSKARRLESGALKIGIVTSIVGIWQYRITFTGEQNHAGTTRMAVRRDAGLALARFCVEIDDRFPAAAVRARCGPPAASRSIRVRRASSRAAPKCCSRSATTTRA